GGDHADGLVGDDDATVGEAALYGLTVDPLGLFGEPLELLGRHLRLALALGERLADLEGQRTGDLVLTLAHELADPANDPRAFPGLGVAPDREALRRRRDSRV